MRKFKDLHIWQDGMRMVTLIYHTARTFPSSEKFGLCSQITRSAISVPSNIAEGCSRNSNTELIRFLEISLGSCFELETQIEISKNMKFIPEQEADQIIHQLHQLQAKINSYRTFLKKHPNTP
jgi:four helix bundle protein